MQSTVLELDDIQKSFGGASALRRACLTVHAGEVLGLVGENGAGKSTLINIATGLFKPDSGVIRLKGSPVILTSSLHAAGQGITVVHQESDLFPQLSIAENMLLSRGLVRNRYGLIRWPATYAAAERMVAALGESFDVRGQAGGLPIARRMMSELSAAVSETPLVLFLDEPTASLTAREIENLFKQIRLLRSAGVGLVYVSHRLEEALILCDRITVMRDGETVDTRPASEFTMPSMVSAMVGRDIKAIFAKRNAPQGDVRIQVKNLTAADGTFLDVSLEVRAGEILGVYGFVGAGRSELGQGLFGLKPVSSGSVCLDGKVLSVRTPKAAVAQGIAYVPEDRLVQGVFRTHSLRNNASVASLLRLSSFGFIRNGEEKSLVADVMRRMNVKATSSEQPIGALSGGNQQKVVFGRWQSTQPKVLILDEPTRGVDVGAKAEIHKLICDLAASGAAIILISSELPEIMGMSDRVVTLAQGRITGEFSPKKDGESAIAEAAVPRSGLNDNPARSASKEYAPSWATRLLAVREVGLMAFIVAVCAGMTAYKSGEFANITNFLDVLSNAALPAIMAQGAMLIICAGGIDISVGSMVGLVSACSALAAVHGAPPLVTLAIALSLGAALSALNAATALLARIHPIIVTLAGLSIYRGLMRIVTGGSEIMELPPSYRALADGNVMGIPKICYYVVIVTIVVHILVRYTLAGRHVMALGNSESAARLIGLSKARVLLFAFSLSGLLVGLTAVLHSGYYGKVQANTGEGMELKAIAAAVIGGTNILGGRGSALGTLLGAFLVSLLYNALTLAHASSYWQNMFVGALILLAVIADQALQRAQRRHI